jgi:MOSC domain-containing protein YiiM
MAPGPDAVAPAVLGHVTQVEVAMLQVSRRHRYEGRPADGALPADEDELRDRVDLRAGLGIVGDRYFAARAHVHATVTVIGLEALEDVGAALGVDLDPTRTRRNVYLRGVDVEALRGEPFSLDSGHGPVLFRGYRPANPCAWMDHEIAPGAFRAMRGRGGVRCDPESDGVLSLGPAVLRTARPVPVPPAR